MFLVIIGAGKVGETLVENFVKENHDVVVVDTSYEKVSAVGNRYDVKGICGGGLERDVLLSAGADSADFVIACTPRDEMNILCCVLAKKIGAKHTIARVRAPEYFKEMENMRSDLGLDYAFNPELTTAQEIAHVLKFPSARSMESFAGGRARMAQLEIGEGSPLAGKSLREISGLYGNMFLIAVVTRGEKAIIPHGDFVVERGDTVDLIASETELIALFKQLKIYKPRARSAFIVGGGTICYYLARELLDSGVAVKIVEKDEERAKELSAELPSATVLVGDGAEQEVLDEENLKGSDACVTLTGMDEENVMISLYAKQRKVDKIVTKIDRPSILKTVKILGLDTVVSPRFAIANHIVRFVRSMQAEAGKGMDTLYKIGTHSEAAEFTVSEGFKGAGIPLKNLPLKKDILLGGIVRGDEFILPGGESTIEPGDRVIVISETKRINELSQILKRL